MNNLNCLINNLSKNFNKNNFIKLKEIVESYNGNDWKDNVSFNKNNYTRNKIFENENFNIFILGWSENQESPIHNHPDNGCIMKILDGELIEELYNEDKVLLKKSLIKKDEVTYINNLIGVHKIINKNLKTVTLHVYSPPNFNMKIF